MNNRGIAALIHREPGADLSKLETVLAGDPRFGPGVPGGQVYVGGQTADEADYIHAVTSPTPYVLAFVLGLSFLLLIRLVILPSILSLPGQRSWYLPRQLDWLPCLQADPTPGTLLR